MSDQVKVADIINPVGLDLNTVKARLDTARKILDNWAALEDVGATKDLNRSQIEAVVGLTQQLVDVMENPPA